MLLFVSRFRFLLTKHQYNVSGARAPWLIRRCPQEMSRTLDKTLGTATVRKLASKQPLGIRGIASHYKSLYVTLTAFWHVPPIPVLFWN